MQSSQILGVSVIPTTHFYLTKIPFLVGRTKYPVSLVGRPKNLLMLCLKLKTSSCYC